MDANRFICYRAHEGANKKTAKEKERKESSLDGEMTGLYTRGGPYDLFALPVISPSYESPDSITHIDL